MENSMGDFCANCGIESGKAAYTIDNSDEMDYSYICKKSITP